MRARTGGSSCDDGLDPAAGPAGDPVVRQIFDVPEVRVRVTADLLHLLTCAGCGARTRALAPAGVTAPAVYGPTVTMLAAYLAAQHHVPVARISEILADLARVEVSAGWVMTACARMAAAVEPANEAIKDAITAAPVAHFDETVTRVAGRTRRRRRPRGWPVAAPSALRRSCRAGPRPRGCGPGGWRRGRYASRSPRSRRRDFISRV